MSVVLTTDRWQRVLGAVTQNAAGITLPSPVRALLEAQLKAVVSAARAGDCMPRVRRELSEFAKAAEAAAEAWHRQHRGEGQGEEEEE